MASAVTLFLISTLATVSLAYPLTWEELQDIRSQCPRQNGRYPVYLPHPKECREFFVCDNGRPVAMQCPSVLHFNPTINVCDAPGRAGCTANKKSSFREGQQEEEDARKGRPPTQPLMKKDIRCPPQNRGQPVFLKHERNCGQYYVCDYGMAIWMTCPAGLRFNVRNNICDYPGKVDCSREASLRARHASPDERSPETEPETSQSSRQEQKVEPSEAQPHGLSQNSPGRRDSRCPQRNGATPIFLQHDTSCALYYVCDTGLAILMSCPHHLLFNTDKNVCDQPENVRCAAEHDQSERPPDEPLTVAQDVPEPERVARENPAAPPVMKKDARCPRWNPPVPVFLSHETECGMYYVCDWGYAIRIGCPPGLGFNQATNVCSVRRC